MDKHISTHQYFHIYHSYTVHKHPWSYSTAWVCTSLSLSVSVSCYATSLIFAWVIKWFAWLIFSVEVVYLERRLSYHGVDHTYSYPYSIKINFHSLWILAPKRNLWQSTQSAITKYHRHDALNHRNLLSHSSRS